MSDLQWRVDAMLSERLARSARLFAFIFAAPILILILGSILGVGWAGWTWLTIDSFVGRSALAMVLFSVAYAGTGTACMLGLLAIYAFGKQLIKKVVFTIVIPLDEAFRSLDFTEEIDRGFMPVAAGTGVAAVVVAAAFFVLGNPDEASALRFISWWLPGTMLIVILSGHYQGLRAARASGLEFREAADLLMGFGPSLTSGLSLILMALVLTYGVELAISASGRAGRSVHNRLGAWVEQSVGRSAADRQRLDRFKSVYGTFLDEAKAVTADVSVRRAPSSKAPQLARIEKGDSVTLLKKEGEWVQVHSVAGVGWAPAGAVTCVQKEQNQARMYEQARPVFLVTMFAAGIAILVVPILLRRTGGLAWGLVASVAGTLFGNWAVKTLGPKLGSTDQDWWPLVLVASLASLVASLVLERRVAKRVTR